MEVREAVKIARDYVTHVYGDEDIREVGLDEVSFNHSEDVWEITIGFHRLRKLPLGKAFGNLAGSHALAKEREYKTIRVDDNNGEVKSMAIRTVTAES